MPSMANITIKENDGTTDVTYTALVPSSGDKAPALWREELSVGGPNIRPVLSLMAKSNGPQTTRIVEVVYKRPQATEDTTTGIWTVRNTATFTGTWIIPTGMPQADIDEFASQCANLQDAPLIVSCVKTGFAPT